MNCQIKPPQIVLDILKERGVSYGELYYYAYPQLMGNTAGNGAGGQSMSIFTINAYVCDDVGPTVYLLGRYFFFEDKAFKPFRRIKPEEWNDINTGGMQYDEH